ncbi:MAG TPA: hypothetical protein VMU95_40745 [Trebonia sp.]|nr:hypothetical protein [Trebonia sp.]
MHGDIGQGLVYPVANPDLREGKRQRLIRAAMYQALGRVGPVRQKRYRDEVVSPLALESSCRQLLSRTQTAIATTVYAGVYAANLSGAVRVEDLRRHEWEIAVALREISELLAELAASFAAGGAGPMTMAVVVSQNRAILTAREGITTRVEALERLAVQVAAAEAARRDWETAHQMAARNDKYLDLVARTAADERASAEISGLADRAAEAATVLRETLAEATLAAEALVLPEAR